MPPDRWLTPIQPVADRRSKRPRRFYASKIPSCRSLAGTPDFPPVLIKVEAEGNLYDEMHVDGGTASQIFLYPAGLDWTLVTNKLEVEGPPHAYLILNSFLEPEWETVKPKIMPIAGKSTDFLIRTQGIGDMYRIFLNCQRDGIDTNLAYIPDHFDRKTKETFDPVYLGELFDLGYQMAKEGYLWVKGPPGFE